MAEASSIRGSKAYITIMVMDKASEHIKAIRKEYAELVSAVVRGTDAMTKAQGRAVSGFKHLVTAAHEAAAAAKNIPGATGGAAGGGRPGAPAPKAPGFDAASAGSARVAKVVEGIANVSQRAIKAMGSAAGIAATSIQSLGQAFNTAGASIVSAGSAMASFGSAAAQVGLAGTAAFGASASKAADYQKSLTQIRVLGGLSREEMENIKGDIREIGLSSGLGATETAEATRKLILAGVSGKEAVKDALSASVALKRLGDTSTEQAATILADSAVSFQAKAGQYGAMAASIVEAGRRSSSGVAEVGSALSFAAPTFANAGGTFSELTAVLSSLGAIKGSKAGTDIATMARNLSQARGEVAKFDAAVKAGKNKEMGEKAAAAEALGLKLTEANSRGEQAGITFVNMVEQLKGLREAAIAAGKAGTFQDNLDNMFGEGSKTIVTLLNNYENLQDALKATDIGGSSLKALTAELDASDASAIDKLKAVFEDLAITVGETLLPVIKSAADAIREQLGPLADWIKANENQVRSLAAAFVGLFLSGTALGIISKIVTGIGTAFSIVGGIIGTVGTVASLALTGITALAENLSKAVGAVADFVGGIIGLIPGLGGAGAAAKGLAGVASGTLVPAIASVGWEFGKALVAALDFSKSFETIKKTAVGSFRVIADEGQASFDAIGQALSTGNFKEALEVFKAYVILVWDKIVENAQIAFVTLAADIQIALITAFGVVEDFAKNSARRTFNYFTTGIQRLVIENAKGLALWEQDLTGKDQSSIIAKMNADQEALTEKGFFGGSKAITTGADWAAKRGKELDEARKKDIADIQKKAAGVTAIDQDATQKARKEANTASAATKATAELTAALVPLTSAVQLSSDAMARLKGIAQAQGRGVAEGDFTQEEARQGLKGAAAQEAFGSLMEGEGPLGQMPDAMKEALTQAIEVAASGNGKLAVPDALKEFLPSLKEGADIFDLAQALGRQGEATAGQVRLTETRGDGPPKPEPEPEIETPKKREELKNNFADTVRGFSAAAIKAATGATVNGPQKKADDIMKKQLKVAEDQLKSLEAIQRSWGNPRIATFQ